MKQEAAISVFPFPLLTGKGMMFFGTIVFLPIAGAAAAVPLVHLIILCLLFLLIWILYAGNDYLHVWEILSGAQWGIAAPPQGFAGREIEVIASLDVEAPSRPFTLALRFDDPQGTVSEKRRYDAVFDPSGGAAVIKHRTKVLMRGKVSWESVDGRITLSHGILSWQFHLQFAQAASTAVYADPTSAEAIKQGFQMLGSGDAMLNLAGGEGREFDSLRRYAIGDDLRKVDWKRSAQGRGVLVKVYRPESHQRLNIAIDCSRRMGNYISLRQQLDYAAEAASCLVRLASGNEDETGLFAFHHQVVAKIECRKGPRQERRIAEALRVLEVGALEADYQLLGEWARLNRRRSLLILITSISNPASLDAIKMAILPVRRKHLPLVVAIADRDLEQLAREPVKNLDEAYMVAAAEEQLREINNRMKMLTSSGISCLYCQAKDLPAMLQKQYYAMKLSGRL